MNRKHLITILLVAVLAGCSQTTPQDPAQKPVKPAAAGVTADEAVAKAVAAEDARADAILADAADAAADAKAAADRAAAAEVAPATPNVLNLHCEGTGYLEVGEGVQGSYARAFSLNAPPTLTTIRTFSGEATGLISKSPDKYWGTFHTSTGTAYLLSIDRVSGNAILMKQGGDASPQRLEYDGICKELETKF